MRRWEGEGGGEGRRNRRMEVREEVERGGEELKVKVRGGEEVKGEGKEV